MRGPLAPGERGGMVTICARRYRCQGCEAVVVVVPRGVVARRHYAAAAIGLALFLIGVLGAGLVEARRRVSAWPVTFDEGDWVTARRWVRAVDEGRLFAAVRASPGDFSLRQRAARAAMTLVAMSPAGTEGAEACVMRGAERAR